MSRKSVRSEYEKILIKNGLAHLVFYVHGLADIIHPYSIPDFELLSDEFVQYLEKYRSIVPDKVPIVLEITGNHLTEEERKVVDRTIWTHFCLHMTCSDYEARKCFRRCFWYLILMLLSSALLFLVDGISDEIIVNFAYMPFWFFGYRLLTYLILDCLPILKTRKWYRRLASLKLIFSGNEDNPEYDGSAFDRLDVRDIAQWYQKYGKEAEQEVRQNKLAETYLMDHGITALECRVGSIEDIVLEPKLRGREFLSEAMAAYLEQAVPFLAPKSQIRLTIRGGSFSEKDKESARKAVRNYFNFRTADEEQNSKINKEQIMVFGGFVLVSMIILGCWGRIIDVASHEFILMLLWFFGDYLLEFCLISYFAIHRRKKTLKACAEMKVIFRKENNIVEETED